MTAPGWRAIVTTAAFFAAAVASVSPVDAQCARGSDQLTDAPRGDAWLGTFVKTYGPESDEKAKDVWAVEKAYAGDIRVVDDTIIYLQDLCDPTLFKAGARYLVTTADWTDPTSHDTVAWRVGTDDSVRLVTFLPASAYDSVYRVSTLAQALDLMLRGDLPQTDALTGTGDTSGNPAREVVIFAISVAAGAFVLRRGLGRTGSHT